MTDQELLHRWNNKGVPAKDMLDILAQLNGVCTECMRVRLCNLGVQAGSIKIIRNKQTIIPEEVFHAIRYYRNYLTDLTSEEKIQSNSKMMKEIRNHIKKLDMFVKG